MLKYPVTHHTEFNIRLVFRNEITYMSRCLLLMSASNEHKVEHELSDTSVLVTE